MVALFFVALPYMGIRMIAWHSYAGLMLWMPVLLALTRYRHCGHWSLSKRAAVALFSALLMWICVQDLNFIHAHFNNGGWLLMYLLTLVWVADIGAYFSGKRFGRNKLAPGISPGKTREGVAGGLALNAFWITLVFYLSGGWGMDYVSFLLLGLVTSGISVVGDLYESVLKREAGMKDSGKILPGHGGVLDRIDSVIAAAPVFMSGLFWLGAV
jgi:phosphatidate cytidylyltransferase